MGIEAIIALIARYGIPAAQLIYAEVKTWSSKAEVTDADWQKLKDINARPLEFYTGIPPEDMPKPE